MPAVRRPVLAVLLALSLAPLAGRRATADAPPRPTAEPDYTHTPRYCLLRFGDDGSAAVWLVEDGAAVYVDRNANGDLTDDGPPTQPSDRRDLDATRWDENLLLATIRTPDGRTHTDLDLRRWNYGDAVASYGLSFAVDLGGPRRVPMYAGWFGRFWGDDPATAPVIYFGGRFTPQLLRGQDFDIGQSRRLSVCFVNRAKPFNGHAAADAEPATIARIGELAIPATTTITVAIDWPVRDGQPPKRTMHRLDRHCCYWEYYAEDFRVPDDIAPGEATLTLSFDPADSVPFPLATDTLTAPVHAAGE